MGVSLYARGLELIYPLLRKVCAERKDIHDDLYQAAALRLHLFLVKNPGPFVKPEVIFHVVMRRAIINALWEDHAWRSGLPKRSLNNRAGRTLHVERKYVDSLNEMIGEDEAVERIETIAAADADLDLRIDLSRALSVATPKQAAAAFTFAVGTYEEQNMAEEARRQRFYKGARAFLGAP